MCRGFFGGGVLGIFWFSFVFGMFFLFYFVLFFFGNLIDHLQSPSFQRRRAYTQTPPKKKVLANRLIKELFGDIIKG